MELSCEKPCVSLCVMQRCFDLSCESCQPSEAGDPISRAEATGHGREAFRKRSSCLYPKHHLLP